MIKPPRIAECPLPFEARVLDCHQGASKLDSKANSHLIVEVDVLRVHAHRTIVVPGAHHVDLSQWNPLFYVFSHNFGDAIDLGSSFRAQH